MPIGRSKIDEKKRTARNGITTESQRAVYPFTSIAKTEDFKCNISIAIVMQAVGRENMLRVESKRKE